MDLIFMGTPDFSVPVLKGLIENEKYNVRAVITQPDKARGRSGKLVFTPVKEEALKYDIPVYTPKDIKSPEFMDQLKTIPCDLIVVVAFGQILSKEILEYPKKYGCINVHASLLPRWRGAAPMQWAIMSGDKKTGITTMQMDQGLDTGDMLLKKEIQIAEDETAESLHDKLASLGSDLLLETIDGLEKGIIKGQKQDDKDSTYAKILRKDMGILDFSLPAIELERKIRGLNSWPSAYTKLKNKTLKIWQANVYEDNQDYDKFENGQICNLTKKSFLIKTGKGLLEPKEIQLEGKKRMKVEDFLRGVKLETGQKLGD